jgi:hypothetical protein
MEPRNTGLTVVIIAARIHDVAARASDHDVNFRSGAAFEMSPAAHCLPYLKIRHAPALDLIYRQTSDAVFEISARPCAGFDISANH